MNYLISILIIFFSLNTVGQEISTIIGLSYSNKSEIIALGKLEEIDSRIDDNGIICSHLVDSSWNTHYIILEKRKLINDSTYLYTILDIVKINNVLQGSHVLIGSNEFDTSNDNIDRPGFVISLECCYESTDNSWHYKSNQIVKAWSNGNGDEKLSEINPNEIIRLNEGFYLK